MKVLTVLTVAALAASISSAFAAQSALQKTPTSQEQKIYPSPDGQFRAVVRPSGKTGIESLIEIQTSHGRKIFRKDFGSSDGEHGRCLVQARWTPDSNFFVWSMVFSGGHHPWNSPTYFFSRRSRSLRSLDNIVGSITESAFSVSAPNTVQGTRLDRKNDRNVPFSVKLADHKR